MSHLTREQPDAEFQDLVDAVIDGRASPVQQQWLEQLMRDDPALMDYCAGRLVFHAELAESVRPLRIELVQQRRIVIEGEGRERQVLFGETRETRIGGRENVIAIPPRQPERWYRGRGAIFGMIVAGLACGSALIAQRMHRPEAAAATVPVSLPLKNGGFEEVSLAGNSSAYSDAILDWDDYFPCSDSGLYDVERWSQGRLKAKSGSNAVRFTSDKAGWITQRLQLPDGSPLLARKGMVVQVNGWAYLDVEPAKRDTFEISLRHVASTHPAMIQYVADSGEITVEGGAWRSFSIRFALSPSSLVAEVKHKEWGDKSSPTLDLEGRSLSLSIDNFYNPTLLLDDLSVELIEPGQTTAASANKR